jgi:hypothetical protein
VRRPGPTARSRARTCVTPTGRSAFAVRGRER